MYTEHQINSVVSLFVWLHLHLPLPPAPWSWILQIGFSFPLSKHALITRFSFCSISASPLCTAPKSSSVLLSPWTYTSKIYSGVLLHIHGIWLFLKIRKRQIIGLFNIAQGQTKGRARWVAARVANLYRMLRHQWNNLIHGASKLGFLHTKEFLQNYLQFWHTPSRHFNSTVRSQKNLKNIGFMVCQIISLPGIPIINLPSTPTWLRPDLILLHVSHSLYMTE